MKATLNVSIDNIRLHGQMGDYYTPHQALIHALENKVGICQYIHCGDHNICSRIYHADQTTTFPQTMN